MVSLIRVNRKSWVVNRSNSSTQPGNRFDSIEDAAEYLNQLGIGDDEIDLSLCDIYAYDHTTALFTDGGKYSHSME